MSVPRTESGRKADAGSRTTRQGAERSSRQKLADIIRFVQGQEHQADAEVQMDSIVSCISLLMDDALITALETVEQHYVYDENHVSVALVPAVYPVRELINQLRDLQKTRLRDALQRLTQQAN